MIIKDLVVTGLVKLLRHAKIDTLIVEKINEVTKEEIDTLKGIDSNIQEQLTAISNTVNAANTEQTTFKTGIANAVNNIPRNPNSSPLTSSSGLSQFVSELGEIEHGPDVSGVTATADTVLSGYKFVDPDWDEVTGNIPIHESGSISWWAGFETTGLQQGGRPEIDDQCVVSIPMTQDYVGYYKKDSVVQGNIYLPKNKIAHGVRVGRFRNADDSNSIVGTYDSDGTIASNDMVSGTVGYSKGQRIVGNLPEYGTTPGTGYNDQHGVYDVGQIPASSVVYHTSWNRLYVRIPRGIYRRSVRDEGNNVFEIFVRGADLVGALGIDATAILQGYTVAGVAGTLPDWRGNPDHIQDIIVDHSTQQFRVAVHYGLHGYWWDGNSYEYMTFQQVANHIGLDTSKFLNTYTILGRTGTIINRGAYTEHLSSALSGDQLYVRIPNGAYLDNGTGSGQAEITVPQSYLVNLAGLTPDKIVKGNTILSIAGTANSPYIYKVNYLSSAPSSNGIWSWNIPNSKIASSICDYLSSLNEVFATVISDMICVIKLKDGTTIRTEGFVNTILSWDSRNQEWSTVSNDYVTNNAGGMIFKETFCINRSRLLFTFEWDPDAVSGERVTFGANWLVFMVP